MRREVLFCVWALAACDGAPVASEVVPPRLEASPDPAPAAAPSAGALEDALRPLLRAPDAGIDADRLRPLGAPRALAAAIEALLSDPSLSRYERTRAISALRVVDDPRAEQILARVLQDPATAIEVRRVAIKAYGRRAGDRGVALLERFVDDEDRHTREAVIRALAGIDGPAARALLASRASRDPAPDLRALAERLAD